MNDEPQYSRGVVLAAAGWLSTALLLLIAWVAWAVGGPENIHIVLLTSQTACALSAVAAVLHLRCYAARICRLIRVTAGMQGPDADIREIPRR